MKVFLLIGILLLISGRLEAAEIDCFAGAWVSFPTSGVRARLVQLTSDLSAPFRSFETSGHTFRFQAPRVNRESRFEVQAFDNRGVLVERASLTVFPADQMDPLRSWTKGRTLHIRDPRGDLVAFFAQQNISCNELGQNESDLQKGVIVFATYGDPVRKDRIEVPMQLFDQLQENPTQQKALVNLISQQLRSLGENP